MDTKSQIFNSALRLFAENGFEKVSVRSIADAVGIQAASIYNHYGSKEQIMEACYDFYLKNRYNTRLAREQYEPIMKNGTKEEVLNVLNYSWETSISESMLHSFVFIFSRIYTDSRAREIFASEINGSIQYLNEFFNFGIETGRFDTFNIPTISAIFLSSRLFTAHSATIWPEQDIWRKTEVDMFNELVKIVPFRY